MTGTDKSQQLHGTNISAGLEEALEARIKDPLWFLARQWQMGEFEAESGGRPMQVRIRFRIDPFRHIRHGDTPQQELDPEIPLEAVVEPEPAEGDALPPAWRPEQLGYSFSIRASAYGVAAAEYDGRTLDWHDFDLAERGTGQGEAGELTMSPGQVHVPGAPEPRWWEIEQGGSYFDGPDDPEPNILSLMLPEFFYTDVKNWYVLPAPMPTGAMRRIEAVEVVDSFGVVSTIDPIVGADDPDAPEDWAVFALSGEGAAGDLYMAPNTAVAVGQNDLVEEVRFLRDEAANLVWAWERQLSDDAGTLYQTGDTAARSPDPESAPAPPPPEDAALQYRLMSDIDRAWVPYLPQQISDVPALDGQIALRRARSHEGWSRDNPQYRGVLVAETPALAEEEVPPTGLSLKRRHRYAIDAEGRAHFWIGRSRDVAPASRRPLLKVDYLDKSGEG